MKVSSLGVYVYICCVYMGEGVRRILEFRYGALRY